MPTKTAGFHDLATMIDWMEGNCAKINALVTEIAEIQNEFETHFVEWQQRYENAKAAAIAWVEEHDWQEPQWLMDEVNQRLPQMRQQKQERLAELQKEITDLETQREGIEQQNDEAVTKLKKQNPRLNRREEKLKQQEIDAKDNFHRLSNDWRRTARGLGWLLRPGAVRRSREAMEEALEEWTTLSARLAEVRNSWLNLKEKTDETETTLQEAWRLRTAEIARLKRELSELQRDLDGAAKESALDEILDALAEPRQSNQPEFDKLLATVMEAHEASQRYEAGIGQVAELMGLVQGVCEGLTRMAESVRSVKAEQDMHAELTNLKLSADPAVLQFHSLWDQLAPLALDEMKAAAHPAQFAAAVKQAIGERLSNTNIDAMFNTLGNELDQATKQQWG
ncbi:MAG: S46 family peptidase [Armatimonadota bacterium]